MNVDTIQLKLQQKSIAEGDPRVNWAEFNRKYNMTPEDWKEWRATKSRYQDGGYFHCQKCGTTITTSPLITFLIAKGKMGPIVCSSCERMAQG